jgi:hypothetical protein
LEEIMRVEDQTPEQNAAQARLDHLFRHHVPDDPDDAASATLRAYVTRYRLQEAPWGEGA